MLPHPYDSRRSGPRVVLATAIALLALLTWAVAALAAERPVVNARDFGTIQEAIDSLPAEGGVVSLPAGVYDVHEKIRLPSQVELRGEGIDRTILVLADGVRDHLISNADLVEGNAGIVIRDLQLQGNQDGQRRWSADGRLAGGRGEVWSFGVRLVNVTDSLIKNVEASDFAKDGFYLGYSRYSGTYRTKIVGCRARDNGRNGISLTHGSFNLIQGCEIHNNNRKERVGGIQLEPDGDLEVSHNLVIGNRVSGNHTGISLYTEKPSWRGGAALIDNAVCYNVAERNRFVGLWDHFGQGNTFVENSASGSEQDFGPTETTRVGAEFAAECEVTPGP
jgi:parallel beta-helix repeat protein